jgi:hypothetical protein
MKHTKGPWAVEFQPEELAMNKVGQFCVQGPKGTVCVTEESTIEETEANARLISAAPELLEIARAYRNLLRTTAHTEGSVATFHHIESVLAKVEGCESSTRTVKGPEFDTLDEWKGKR